MKRACPELAPLEPPAAAELAPLMDEAVPTPTESTALVRSSDMPAPLALAQPPAITLPENGYVVYFVAQLVSPNSRRAMASTLRQVLVRFFRWEGKPEEFAWHQLRYAHTAALRTWMSSVYAPATANRVLVAVRGILRQCYRLEQLTEREYRLAVDVPCVRGSRTSPGRFVPIGEVRAMFEAIATQPPELAARNAAMLALLYGAGLRRQEVAGLDIESVTPDGGLRLVGKGNKERVVPLPLGARAAMAAWLALRGPEPGPLFWPTKGRGTRLQPGGRLCGEDVYQAVLRWAELAGIPSLSPHDLRRSYGSTLLDGGADIKTAADLMGHSSVLTTARYDRRDERTRVRAAELVCVPFGAQPRD